MPFQCHFEKPDDAPEEPIANAMVAAKTSIAKFGGALRRLLYQPKSKHFDPEFVRYAQCLTEQVIQKALSTKSSVAIPIQHNDYEQALKLLLRGEPRDKDGESKQLREMLDDENLGQVWENLRSMMSGTPAKWQQWLKAPHELSKLLADAEGAELSIPITDLRVRAFIEC